MVFTREAKGPFRAKRLRFFLQPDVDLQGAALRLFLRAVEQHLRAHSPGPGPGARLGAVAFIHRFGSTLNPHLHFHCVVIDGVFDTTTAGGVVFHAAAGSMRQPSPTRTDVRRAGCGIGADAGDERSEPQTRSVPPLSVFKS